MNRLNPARYVAIAATAFLMYACIDSSTGSGGAPPTITAQPENAVVAAGQTAEFTVEAENATTYQWVRNGSDTLSGQTGASLTLSGVTLDMDSSTYTVIVGNNRGEVVSSDALLTVFEPSRALLFDSGQVFYESCAGCHGSEGEGGRAPPLANADYLMADLERSIRLVLNGGEDSIRVNGIFWPGGGMPTFRFGMSDFEIASVLTYIRVALNDTLVTNCVNEDLDLGIEASCDRAVRPASEIASDSVTVSQVAAIRATLDPLD